MFSFILKKKESYIIANTIKRARQKCNSKEQSS